MDVNTLSHVYTNNILYNVSYDEITRNIIKIGSNCKSDGVNDVFISSIFFKKNPALNALTVCANHMLHSGFCVINGFSFIYNDKYENDKNIFGKMVSIYKIQVRVF